MGHHLAQVAGASHLTDMSGGACFASRTPVALVLLLLMAEIGLREVRQNASELVRRAQAGERLTITVSGRPAASLGPVDTASWLSWEAVADVFATPGDPDWPADRERVDGSLRDPWDH